MNWKQTSELWESLNLPFLNSQHSASVHISVAHHSLGRQGIIFLLFPILQMVRLKPCKVYWLTPSCTAGLNGSRTPAGLIPTPWLLAVTLHLLLLTSDYFTALISSPFHTQIISLSSIKPLCHDTQTKLLTFLGFVFGFFSPPAMHGQKFGFFCWNADMYGVSERIQPPRD